MFGLNHTKPAPYSRFQWEHILENHFYLSCRHFLNFSKHGLLGLVDYILHLFTMLVRKKWVLLNRGFTHDKKGMTAEIPIIWQPRHCHLKHTTKRPSAGDPDLHVLHE